MEPRDSQPHTFSIAPFVKPCMCFCMCCITEISPQCPFDNIIFSGKSKHLIMKRGETSKQRQLGGERNVSPLSLSVVIRFSKFREQWLYNSNRSWFQTNKRWSSPGTDIKMWLMPWRKILWLWTNWKLSGAKKRNHLRWLLSSTSRTCWYALRVVDCT